MTTAPTIRVAIFMAGDLAQAKQVCREFCRDVGLCVHLEPVDFIYTGGEEVGFKVGLINYPKYPSDLDDLTERATVLAESLRLRLCQDSYSIVGPLETVWFSTRPAEQRRVSSQAGGYTVAALYVEPEGAYYGLPHVDPWDESRDARAYAGPHPVIAHPPCERWGRFWHGSTRKPHQYKLGDDGGCFAAALAAVRRWGGVLEHPADSRAWSHFNLNPPPREGGWIAADFLGGLTCYVEQGFYGHLARKGTWLYTCGFEPPELHWGEGEQRLHPIALERYGYAKARRIGMMAMVGGKHKKRIRNTTPAEFRDLLISMARCAARPHVPTQTQAPVSK